MPLPSKQNMIYSRMMKMIRDNCKPGDKLPSETQLASMIGVARRSLRSTLSRLEEEGIIERTNRGTFLRDSSTKSGTAGDPVYILVPCPDYYTASGFYSSYLIQQMIQGCVRAAVEHGTYAVTLPITKDNNPNNLNLRQFNHLREGDIVIFNGSWAMEIYSILEKSKCRLGYVTDKELNYFQDKDVECYHLYWGKYWSCLGDAALQLQRDGAKKILYFGRQQTDISKYGKENFLNTLSAAGLECNEKQYVLYDTEMPFSQTLKMLKELYVAWQFDGLIFDSNLYSMQTTFPDFYQETGIPHGVRMICNVSEFLRYSGLPPHTRILHRPQKAEFKKMVDRLLSANVGNINIQGKYEFPYLAEFFEETNFLEQ